MRDFAGIIFHQGIRPDPIECIGQQGPSAIHELHAMVLGCTLQSHEGRAELHRSVIVRHADENGLSALVFRPGGNGTAAFLLGWD